MLFLPASRRAPRPGFRTLAPLTVAAFVLAACGGSKSTTDTSTVGPLKTISLAPSTAALVIGDTLRVTASLYDANSNAITTDTVTWRSGDTTIATVSDSGTIKAIAAGSTYVYATAKSIVDSLDLVVTPPTTKALLGLATISAGFAHSCALDSSGGLYCWGSNALRQIGNDTSSISAFPLQVATGAAYTVLSAGYAHSCAVTAGGLAFCWGDNSSEALGNTSVATTTSTPVAVAGGLIWAKLSAGYSHTCGITTGGDAYCWGANESGELGNGAVGTANATPGLVAGGMKWAAISAGGVYSCGITTAGAGYCWGSNAYGALGDGTTTDSPVPVAVAGGLTLASISAGVSHSCAVTTSGAAYCWGAGSMGQLGNGVTSLNSTTPVAVVGGNTFAMVTTGEQNTCALTPTGRAYCWGSGAFGDLGTGSTTNASTPQLVSDSLTFTSLSAGISFHVCGRTTDSAAYCWGYNDSGELGNAAAGGYSTTPQQVVVPNN